MLIRIQIDQQELLSNRQKPNSFEHQNHKVNYLKFLHEELIEQ